jgi:hypothetical protein
MKRVLMWLAGIVLAHATLLGVVKGIPKMMFKNTDEVIPRMLSTSPDSLSKEVPISTEFAIQEELSKQVGRLKDKIIQETDDPKNLYDIYDALDKSTKAEQAKQKKDPSQASLHERLREEDAEFQLELDRVL